MSDCSGRTGRTCSGLSCVVCLEAFMSGEELIVLPQCKHRFHAACITQWLRQANSCPSCRTLAVQREPPRPEITAMATPELATAAASALSRTNTDGQMSRAQPPAALSNNTTRVAAAAAAATAATTVAASVRRSGQDLRTPLLLSTARSPPVTASPRHARRQRPRAQEQGGGSIPPLLLHQVDHRPEC